MLEGVRVLMVSHSYSPDAVGIAPYATETAEKLVQEGAQVTVLTMPPHYPQWRVAEGTRRGWNVEHRHGVQVVRIPTYVPSNPTLFRRLLFEGTWLLGAAPLAASRAVRKADIVIGVHPGLFGSAFAAAVAGRRPLLQIVQDLVGQAAVESGMSGAARARRVLASVEGRALRRADQLTVPSAGFIEPMRRLGVSDDRIIVVPNWSRNEQDFQPTPPPDRGPFTVLHAGNMGLKQGLELLEPSLRRAADLMPGTHFAFVGAGSAADALREAVGSLPNVVIHPHLPEEEFWTKLADAHVFLVHERPSVVSMSLPSKLTTYFAAGRPVLAVTPPGGLTAAEVERAGAGINVAPGDVDAFIDAVARLRDDPDLAREFAAGGRDYSAVSLQRKASLEALAESVARLAGSQRQRR